MAKPLSYDLRVRVLEAVAEGLSYRAAAARFRISVNTIVNWRALERENGSPERRPMGGDRSPRRIDAERDAILGIVGKNPDLTATTLRAVLAQRGLVFGYRAMRGFLKRHGVTLKKGRPRKKPLARPRQGGHVKPARMISAGVPAGADRAAPARLAGDAGPEPGVGV